MRTATPAQARLRQWTAEEALEASILLVAFVALGFLLVPAHWTSIWTDREFTGWVAPIANRLVDGQRLYADGMHSPMPPLSFVLVRLVSGGNATWLTESVLNYVFQVLTLLASWMALRRIFGKRVGFVATLCAVPFFLALPKTIFYDAAVQLWVALAAWILAARPRRWPVLLGLVSALAVMTKQSTGLGLVAGAALALVVIPAEGGVLAPASRKNLALYFASLLLAFGVLLLVLAPWSAPGGLVHDVLLTGSEPKGGSRALVEHHIGPFARELGLDMLRCGLVLGVAAIVVWRLGLIERFAGSRSSPWLTRTRRWDADRRWGLALVIAALLGVAIGSATWTLDSPRLGDPQVGTLPRLLQDVALPAFVLVGIVLLWRERRQRDPRNQAFLRAFGVLLLCAVAASLSVNIFRWTYDSNPLIPFVLACIVAAAIWLAHVFEAVAMRRGTVLALGAVLALSALSWAHLGDQVRAARDATVTWPEVNHLRGAKLRPRAHGMRALVHLVRRLAAPRDSVLLLPEDPNVEAWFERPRPRLSSAIVFVDQYWDRYVDADFARLRRRPPKVIVIGPRNFWRGFSRLTGRGAERLIDRVKHELLPRRYAFERGVPIAFVGPGLRAPSHTEWMDVWVRR